MHTATTLTPDHRLRSTAWPVLTELTPDAAQQVFHDMMEAMSRPGTVKHLGQNVPDAPIPAALVPILTLADLMAPITVFATQNVDESEAATVAALLTRLTGAPTVAPAQARLALALEEAAEWGDLNQGSHWSPEHGALLVQRVGSVSETSEVESQSEGLTLRLTGPGIHPEHPTVITVAGLSRDWYAQREQLTSSYPAGIDCTLMTDAGIFVCIPRTTKIEVL